MATRVSARLTAAEGRRFAFTVGGAFIALSALLAWRERVSPALVTASMGTLLLIAGLLAPSRLGPVHRAWNMLSLALSKLTTPIFMGVVYFVVVTPTGVIRRLLGYRFLPNSRAQSFWTAREARESRTSLERQF